MATSTQTKENAERAVALIDAIVQREKCTKRSVFKRLGITGGTMLDIVRLTGCTPTMLARVETEHARVFGKNGTPKVLAPAKVETKEPDEEDEDALEDGRDESDEDESDEDESDEDEEQEDEEQEDDEQEDDEQEDEDVDELDDGSDGSDESGEEPALRPRAEPTLPRNGTLVVNAIDAVPATGKTEAARAAARLSDADSITTAQLPGLLSALARTVAVVEQLGGIERAERIAAAISEVR